MLHSMQKGTYSALPRIPVLAISSIDQLKHALVAIGNGVFFESSKEESKGDTRQFNLEQWSKPDETIFLHHLETKANMDLTKHNPDILRSLLWLLPQKGGNYSAGDISYTYTIAQYVFQRVVTGELSSPLMSVTYARLLAVLCGVHGTRDPSIVKAAFEIAIATCIAARHVDSSFLTPIKLNPSAITVYYNPSATSADVSCGDAVGYVIYAAFLSMLPIRLFYQRTGWYEDKSLQGSAWNPNCKIATDDIPCPIPPASAQCHYLPFWSLGGNIFTFPINSLVTIFEIVRSGAMTDSCQLATKLVAAAMTWKGSDPPQVFVEPTHGVNYLERTKIMPLVPRLVLEKIYGNVIERIPKAMPHRVFTTPTPIAVATAIPPFHYDTNRHPRAVSSRVISMGNPSAPRLQFAPIPYVFNNGSSPVIQQVLEPNPTPLALPASSDSQTMALLQGLKTTLGDFMTDVTHRLNSISQNIHHLSERVDALDGASALRSIAVSPGYNSPRSPGPDFSRAFLRSPLSVGSDYSPRGERSSKRHKTGTDTS